MKNALVELAYTRQISNEKPDPKTFYRFVSNIEQIISDNEVKITPNIRMKLINQPKSEEITTFNIKDYIIVFGQVVQQNSLFEGQIRKITMQQALKFDMVMKKLKTNSYLQQNKFISHMNTTSQNDNQNTSSVIGHRNGGFYSHF